ncbi:sensor histidine kinase [Paenibacillus puldeungensis]|uniref:histidine kinase n=1 Tax=Paenibacillus puldeungensis TaxID=696536 RepID=A0ABW3RZN7_9BACL
MNKGSLRKKLLVSHLGVAIMSLLAIMALVYGVMYFSFGKYTENQRQTEAQAILDDLQSTYNVQTGGWGMDTLMRITHEAMMRSYDVKIYDRKRQLIWDTNRMGMMGHSMAGEQEKSQTTAERSQYSLDIRNDGQTIGTLEIQGLEDVFAPQNQQFLQMFSTLLWVALLIVVMGVCVFSVYLANGLSRPLQQIKRVATRMREGDLSSRVELAANQKTEIEEVALSLNHLADALQQQEKLRKNLTADIAHELRTPIATIQSHIEAFQDGVWEPSPDKLEVCHEQVVRLVKLIHDLEYLTALENPMLKLQREKVNLNEVVRNSVNAVKGQFTHKNIILDIEAKQEIYINGDYDRLVQVFSNLLNNAYKYTSEGSICVSISESTTDAEVSITDTGTGIAPDELPLIFERFYRGDKSRNRKTGGAGIGLAIVKAIVEAHGGTVHVNSIVEHGTQFCVRIPK